MADLTGLTDVAQSVAGITEKATLFVHTTGGAEKLNSKKVASSTASVLSGEMSAFGGPATGTHMLKVQYNPSSLTIQANAESIPFKTILQHVDNGVPAQNLRAPMVVLSVELVFDAMNTQDAFMMDRTRLSLDTLATDARAVAKEVNGGYSVQPQTNGLLAMILRPSTKLVTFAWADMSFTGEVMEAEAHYTMFSPSGRPIRSVVRMNISQQVESAADAQYWENAMDEVFCEIGSFEGKGAGQKLGNILNLGAF